MATYKVIQDIEAEDKLLGPLTFRQFIYAGICVGCLWITFLFITKGFPLGAVITLPIAAAGGFFAWPWSRDQPTEVWALAKIRFMLKPRKRIWNQSGVKELVTVTAPKKVQVVYSNNLSEDEVRNRLRALADTIDSRGWAIKNVNVNMFTPQSFVPADSDRLVNASTLPKTVDDVDIKQSDDILEESNPVARQFDTMIAASTKAHREEILNSLRETGKAKEAQANQEGNNYWFMNQQNGASAATVPQDAVTFNTQVVTPGTPPQQSAPMQTAAPVQDDTTLDEAALIEKLHQQDLQQQMNPYNHWHTIQPLSEQNQGTQQPGQTGVQNLDYSNIPNPRGASPQAMAQGQSGMNPQWPQPPMPVGAQAFPQQPGQAQVLDQNQMAFNGPQMAGMQNGQQPQSQGPPMPGGMPQLAVPTAPRQAQPQVTPAPDPAILQLASNDDLDVATLARQANKHKEELRDEVVISLH